MKIVLCACFPAEIAACVQVAPAPPGLQDQPCQLSGPGKELPAGSVIDAVSSPVALLPVSVTLKETLAPWCPPWTLMLAESLTTGAGFGLGFGLGGGELLVGVAVGFGVGVGRGVGLLVFGDLLFAAAGRVVCWDGVGRGAELVVGSDGSATRC